MPFQITPIIYAALGVGILVGAWHFIDMIRAGAIAENEAVHVAADAKAKEEAQRQADAAEAARLPAALPGSVARLRASWCRDCEVAP